MDPSPGSWGIEILPCENLVVWTALLGGMEQIYRVNQIVYSVLLISIFFLNKSYEKLCLKDIRVSPLSVTSLA